MPYPPNPKNGKPTIFGTGPKPPIKTELRVASKKPGIKAELRVGKIAAAPKPKPTLSIAAKPSKATRTGKLMTQAQINSMKKKGK